LADQNFRVKRGLEVGAGATVLVAESSGNIGIGSTQPTATLDVNGDINLTGTFYQNSSPFVASRWTAGSGDDIYRLNGNVGVGTTNPTAKLDVNGTLNVTGISTFQNNVHILDDDRFRIGGQVGTFDGFELFHIGNNSYISDSGTGFLAVLSNQFKIKNAFDSEDIAIFNENGSVELYYDNSKKFETTGYGVTVSGGLNVSGVSTFQGNAYFGDNDVIYLGNSNDLEIRHNGTHSYIKDTGEGYLIFQTNNNFVAGQPGFIFEKTDGTDLAVFNVNSGIDLYHDGDLKFQTTGYGVSITGNIDVDNTTSIGSSTSSLSTLTQTAIHTELDIATYRSVEYTIQATEGTNFHATKILALHNGTTAYHSEYGTIFNNSSVASFDVDISGGNLRLLATGASASQTDYVVNFVATKV